MLLVVSATVAALFKHTQDFKKIETRNENESRIDRMDKYLLAPPAFFPEENPIFFRGNPEKSGEIWEIRENPGKSEETLVKRRKSGEFQGYLGKLEDTWVKTFFLGQFFFSGQFFFQKMFFGSKHFFKNLFLGQNNFLGQKIKYLGQKINF